MKANPTCRVCDVELDEENWFASYRKKGIYTCKECDNKRSRLWRKTNPEKAKAAQTRFNRKQGMRPFSENKECAQFLGIHIAERVLSHVFKDVKRMPYGHPGFDVICNRDKKIDIKSSCQRKDGKWGFNIHNNTIADYFLCLAFDNREDLNPLHAWLIPGKAVNHLVSASISPSTINKWDAYQLELSKISDCCNTLR